MTDIYFNPAVLERALDALCSPSQGTVTCCVGFDGYIDELYHVVSARDAEGEARLFDSIEAFGQRVLKASGKSADLEILLSKRKLGGNGPILSNALATLGLKVTCVGTLDNDIRPDPFQEMPPTCKRLSFGRCSKTVALEFGDGKVMLGDLCGNCSTWEELKRGAGLQVLQDACLESRLVAIVNWSGLSHRQEILDGYLHEVCGALPPGQLQDKIFFFDLADPTVLSGSAMEEFLETIRAYSRQTNVILSLNENEACQIGQHCCPGKGDLLKIGKELLGQLGLTQAVIHTNRQAMAFSRGTTGVYEGMYVEHPVISTGAGDHFNAGYLWGTLRGLGPEESLVLGQGEASYYLSTGLTPKRKQLAAFIEKQLEKERVLYEHILRGHIITAGGASRISATL